MPKANESSIACIITAYRDLSLTRPLIDSLLKQKYSNYHIFLIADRCDPNISYPLSSDRLSVEYPEAALDSKVKSMLYAIEQMDNRFDACLIFDPDNIAHPDLMGRLNQVYNMGHVVVQGQRAPKNLDTALACLDAACDYYYNYSLRIVMERLGLSAPISGSGMLVETTLFKSCLEEQLKPVKQFIDEDKLLQLSFVEQGHRIAYDHDAIVYDEKVAASEQLQKQRTRWIASYFLQIPRALKLSLKGLFKANVNQFVFGFLVAYPPLFSLALASVILLFVDAIFFPNLALLLLFCGLVFTINFILTLKWVHAPQSVFKALWKIPFFVINQMLAVLKIKRTTRNDAPTKNTKQMDIDNLVTDSKSTP